MVKALRVLPLLQLAVHHWPYPSLGRYFQVLLLLRQFKLLFLNVIFAIYIQQLVRALTLLKSCEVSSWCLLNENIREHRPGLKVYLVDGGHTGAFLSLILSLQVFLLRRYKIRWVQDFFLLYYGHLTLSELSASARFVSTWRQARSLISKRLKLLLVSFVPQLLDLLLRNLVAERVIVFVS